MCPMENYIILTFGGRRVLLYSPNRSGATMTKHPDGHTTLAFDGCEVIGSVLVADDEPEPTVEKLLSLLKLTTTLPLSKKTL